MNLRVVKAWMQARFATDHGAALVEYVLLVGLIALVAILGVTFLGSSTQGNYSMIGSGFAG